MSKKLKVIGLTVFAALAVSAVAAISASGSSPGHFTAASAPVAVHAVQEGTNNFFTDNPLPAVECEVVTFSGNAANTTETSLIVTPKFEKCKSSPGTVHVNTNGCFFTLTIETHTTTTFNNVHTACPNETKHITLSATSFVGECHIKIPPQTTAGGVKYTQAGNSVTVDVNAIGITSTKHPSDFFGLACAGAATHGEGGVLEGQVLAKANNGAVAIQATGSTGH